MSAFAASNKGHFAPKKGAGWRTCFEKLAQNDSHLLQGHVYFYRSFAVNKLEKILVLTTICIGKGALTQVDGNEYELIDKNALNSSLDDVVGLIVKMVNELLKEFYPEILINVSAARYVDIQTGIAERKIQVEPADLVTPKLRNTLLKTIMLTTKGLIEGADCLFSAPVKSALTTDELDFINEWTVVV